MSFDIKLSSNFEKEAKRLMKKYASLREEIEQLISSLSVNPIQGDSIGKNCYKIRVPISSKGKGKSGGARVITNIVVLKNVVYLLTIYDKSDMDNISANDLKQMLKELPD